jgi:hypothetical protein
MGHQWPRTPPPRRRLLPPSDADTPPTADVVQDFKAAAIRLLSALRRTHHRLLASARAGLALHNSSMRLSHRGRRLSPMLLFPLLVRNMRTNSVSLHLASNLQFSLSPAPAFNSDALWILDSACTLVWGFFPPGSELPTNTYTVRDAASTLPLPTPWERADVFHSTLLHRFTVIASSTCHRMF